MTSHFDTHAFVEKLEKQGLTRVQAEGVMTVLAEVVDESIKGMEVSLVSKAEQEKVSLILCGFFSSGLTDCLDWLVGTSFLLPALGWIGVQLSQAKPDQTVVHGIAKPILTQMTYPATLHPESRFRSTQIRTPAARKE